MSAKTVFSVMIATSLLKPKLYSKIKPKDFSDGLIHESDSDKMVSPFSSEHAHEICSRPCLVPP